MKATLGPLTYSFSYTYNGKHYGYSYNYGGSGYQAQRAQKGKLKPYWSKLDPTADQVESPASYMINGYIAGSVSDSNGSSYRFGTSLQKITDGTSNTFMFGEGYSHCGTRYNYSNTSYYEFTYDRVWNYDPMGYSYTYTYQSSPYVYSYSGTTYPYFYSFSAMQVMPTPPNCSY